MNKQTLLLVAGAMIAFASCNSSNDNKANSQAVIDSLANVKAVEMQAQAQAQNDSTIKAMAQAKADSEMAFKKGEEKGKMEANASAKKHTGAGKTAKETAQPETVGDGKPSMNGNTQNNNGNAKNNGNTIGNGKPKM